MILFQFPVQVVLANVVAFVIHIFVRPVVPGQVCQTPYNTQTAIRRISDPNFVRNSDPCYIEWKKEQENLAVRRGEELVMEPQPKKSEDLQNMYKNLLLKWSERVRQQEIANSKEQDEREKSLDGRRTNNRENFRIPWFSVLILTFIAFIISICVFTARDQMLNRNPVITVPNAGSRLFRATGNPTMNSAQ